MNRFSYAANGPVLYRDPSGHAYVEGYNPEGNDQCVNCRYVSNAEEVGNNIGAVFDFAASIVAEPLDWMITARDCFSGDCSPLSLLGLLPVIPGTVGRRADDVVDLVRHADEAADVARAAEKAAEGIGTGTHTVYRNIVEGGVEYVGSTGNFAQRRAQQAWKGRAIRPFIEGLSKSDALAVEQVLIEHYRSVQPAGVLSNIRNAIGPRNPIYPQAVQRAREILGQMKPFR